MAAVRKLSLGINRTQVNGYRKTMFVLTHKMHVSITYIVIMLIPQHSHIFRGSQPSLS